jgi:hypothetical protein
MMKELKNPQAQEIQEKLDRQKNQLLEENEKAKQVEDVQKVKSKVNTHPAPSQTNPTAPSSNLKCANVTPA